ncbi:16S rRNA (guanine(527)-N(7))-methyltransferase RsmG [Pengzhenrongella sicca]|uniref:Ribosomal RNA small subunit methyltransferase G n=1 Tax=Pengzhenrongella sicca TaxID=2819238 RepID=A0A8A4ZMC2_9MICO|nr:16S rRNA (guanine(527)-N(7))-methyltransferase RsmG [Pengzhenrongella sicca]
MAPAEADAAPDPLTDDPRLIEYFGEVYPVLARFHALLTEQGVLRGLIGPREAAKLWERHILNSAAVAPLLPSTGRLVDVGSGAGLPGIVLAVMLPEVEVTLLEPMERRIEWLREVVEHLGLTNVDVRRGRAEDLHGELQADAITARAVAPLDRLARWTLPLLVQGGVLIALKGRHAAEEVESAKYVIKKLGGGAAQIVEVGTVDGVDITTAVRVVRETVRGSAGARAASKRTQGSSSGRGGSGTRGATA